MNHPPRRSRTAQSGACSYCVRKKTRCYVGAKGVPCSSCRRLNLACDGKAALEIQGKSRIPSLTYCAEEHFASQIQKPEHAQFPRDHSIAAVSSTDPLDNYISIIHQLLGPDGTDSPGSVDNIPDYVTGLPNRLEPGDMEYLASRGALCIPTARFRTELLKSYILWVHPQVPVLDLEVFLLAIAENDGENRISLLLYHAVMFAASTFVDIAHIHNEGYASRKAARDVLFRRAKALLELDCENDRLLTVQALLLLIHWSDVRDGDKDSSHWMGICLSLAISIGLHRSPDQTAMTPSQQQTWRRTWWSVYNHARLTADGLLAMMSIEQDRTEGDSFDTPMISLSDFPFGVYSPEAHAVVEECEVPRTIEYQKAQALVFIDKTRICRLSEFSRFSNHVAKLVLGADSVEIVPATRGTISDSDHEKDLRQWFSRLDSVGRHQYPVVLTPTPWERSVYLHRTWLRLLYLGSGYAARCDELQALDYVFVDPMLLNQYLLEMTDLFEEIDSLGLSSQLPSPCTALLVLLLTFHRRAVNTGPPHMQAMSACRLHRCWKIMHQMRETSQLADLVIPLLSENGGTDIWERLSSALLF